MIRDFFIYDQTENIINIQIKYANNSPVNLANTNLILKASKNPYINADFTISSNSEIVVINASTGTLQITFSPNLNLGVNDTEMLYQLTGEIANTTYTYMQGRFYVTNSLV